MRGHGGGVWLISGKVTFNLEPPPPSFPMDSEAFFPISCAAINAKAHLSWKCWGFPSMKFPLHHGFTITIYIYIPSHVSDFISDSSLVTRMHTLFIDWLIFLSISLFIHSFIHLNLCKLSCTTAFYEAHSVWSFLTVSQTHDVVFNLHKLLFSRPHLSWSRHSLRPRLEAVDF